MWRVVFLIIAFVTLCASAEAQLRTPSGCFVTDLERGYFSPPPSCFNEERMSSVPLGMADGYSAEDVHLMYGFQYGNMINFSYDVYLKWQDAESRAAANLANSDIHYGWYVAEFNRGKQLKALEAKLRKACGSKCKKIKTIKSFSDMGSSETLREPSKAVGQQSAPMSYSEYFQKGLAK
jgi:hypothetical protein